MKITQTTPTKPGVYEHKTGNAQISSTYKIGQILEARVLSNSSHGQVNLRVGNVEITAATKIPLAHDAHLSLKVIQLQPQLLLQVMSSPLSSALQDAKLNFLPRQMALAPLLSELIFKAQSKEVGSQQNSLRAIVDMLVAATSVRNDLKTSDGLRRAIRQSGLFLEAKLANMAMTSPHELSADMKSLLFRYLNILSQAQKKSSLAEHTQVKSESKQQCNEVLPPLKGDLPIKHPRVMFDVSTMGQGANLVTHDMLKKIQGALARLGLLQVATAENFDDGKCLWQLEIPVRQGNAVETVSLTIKKEQKNGSQENQESTNWSVNLSLDLPRLGALQCRINKDQQGLSTTFWSDSTDTLAVIESQLSLLRKNFEQQGLKAYQFGCRAGHQPAAESSRPDSPLIDCQV